MRPNSSNKRPRGRNRSKNSNPLSRSYESNGPDVKIRGSALQVADKYAQLARDSQSSGDRVQAENYLQHAEHYYRIVASAYEQSNQQAPREQQREPGERNRFDDRQPYRTNEQPNINGFDGVEEDDEGVRSALRFNGNGNGNGNNASHDDDDGDDEQNAAPQQEPAPKPSTSRRRPAKTARPVEDSADTSDEQPIVEPVIDAAAGTEASEETEAPKPKRRARSTTRRPRAPRRTDDAESADATAEQQPS
ncbi:DUF4167 domain-containing protein [Acuticoccus sp. MNP-M23]|uniref:DUF4167 domain-containing protein n=1 Tax=Acuticoccus sp. MNP-M23 TaxID=3072793 RepID=UPI0028163CCD|nr:DUF4167 domain-containing protein [Acuticoccus sp. MNP-M23]WMS41541.1 DUF4167 domain-containing protein [Acuticoccus sp. MNP-M23]